jgi:hexokinase
VLTYADSLYLGELVRLIVADLIAQVLSSTGLRHTTEVHIYY